MHTNRTPEVSTFVPALPECIPFQPPRSWDSYLQRRVPQGRPDNSPGRFGAYKLRRIRTKVQRRTSAGYNAPVRPVP